MARATKYTEIKRIIREYIRTKYPVGSKIPSTTDLHNTLQVSQGTVNRALRDLVEEGLVERFEGRGTFVSRGNKNRGFLWPSSPRNWASDQYPADILHAVEQEAYSRGRQILVSAIRDVTQPEFTAPGSNKAAGVMIIFNLDHRVVEAYHKEHLPVVLIDPSVRTAGVPFVTSDHFSAGREATLYLGRLGHKRITFVGIHFPFVSIPLEERILGYKEAMREMNNEENVRIYLVHPTVPDRFVSLETTDIPTEREFLALVNETQTTACCCFDDLLAVQLIRMCHDGGIRVPDDMSIVGINDTKLASHIWPALTTIHLPIDEIGSSAVRMLDKLIEEDRLLGSSETLPVYLVERASAKPLATGKSSRKK